MLLVALLAALLACSDKDAQDTAAPEPQHFMAVEDADGDGYPGTVDCDDTDATIHPGAAEVCNGLDDDCDGAMDDDDPGLDTSSASVWYADVDGDGWGGLVYGSYLRCAAPAGYVAQLGDCDDLDPLAWPGAPEVCDGTDNDCDGVVDGEDSPGAPTWYIDFDGDGWGDDNEPLEVCGDPGPGFAARAGDCDDSLADVHPGAVEVCNGLDDDCDGAADDWDASLDLSTTSTWFVDMDGDSWGHPSWGAYQGCDAGTGYVGRARDCDDEDGAIHPGAIDVPGDGIDQDCDGVG